MQAAVAVRAVGGQGAGALKTWLLDRCEERSLWFGADGEPVPMTVNRLADRLRTDADVVSVARLLRARTRTWPTC